MNALEQSFFERICEEAGQDNLLPNTYELRRRAFRLASYGCYSKKDLLSLLGCKKRTYNNFLSLCATVLPEHCYQSIRYKQHQRPTLRGSSYESNENFLAETYRLKSLTAQEICFFIHILRVLSDPAYHPDKKITQQRCNVYTSYTFDQQDLPDERTMNGYFRQLAAFGLIRNVSPKKSAHYVLTNDPFANLSQDEVKDLLFAVDYLKNASLLSVPGYFLADTLCSKLNLGKERHQPFYFKNLDLRRILDDDIVYKILCAIENRHYLQILWYHKPRSKSIYTKTWLPVVRPIAILEEELGDGRRQLLALFPDENKTRPTFHRIRIEEILSVECFIPETEMPLPHITPEQVTEIQLRVHWNTAEEKYALLSRLNEELPSAAIHEEGASSARCSFLCSDQKKYLPVLRTFLPYALVLQEPKSFIHRQMQHSIAETLLLYTCEPIHATEQNQMPPCKTISATQTPKKPHRNIDKALQVTMFQEIYCGVYRWLVTTHNALCHAKTAPTMQALLNDAPYQAATHRSLFSRYLMAAFHFTLSKNKTQALTVKQRDFVAKLPEKLLPILPTTLELRWLKTVLHAPEADFLLDASLKEKLLTSLSHIKAFDLSAWKRQRNRKDIKERPAVHEALKTILHALRVHQSIQLNGVRYAPLRLCQNVSTGIYHLLCCNLQSYAICSIHEDQFPACHIDINVLSQEETTATEYAWQQYAPSNRTEDAPPNRPYVAITFHDRFNARERAYTMFSSFDKESFIERDGSYHLKVFYQPFEEEEILRRILSFGSYVTVLAPNNIRAEIVRRLRKAQALYAENAHTAQ